MFPIDPKAPETEALRILEDHTATVEQRLGACRALIDAGETGAAILHLAPILEKPDLRADALAVLNLIPALKPARRSIGADSPIPAVSPAYQGNGDLGYWIVPAQSKTTVIVFIGFAMRLDVAIYFFQRLLKRHNFNVIYVFDWTSTYYHAGIKGLGANLRRTIAGLRQKCEELGTRRLICLGQSAGGYGAIMYGIRLKADGVLAFSPVILSAMTERNLKRISQAKRKPVERSAADLRQLFADSRIKPYTKIVFGADNKDDVASARHLSTLPNVAEHPLPGIEIHGSVEAATLSGEFTAIVTGFCDEVGRGRWHKRSRQALKRSRRSNGSARIER